MDIEQIGAAVDEALMRRDRLKAGQLLLQVRPTIPARGPRAKAWGDFVAARGISLDSATRYIQRAQGREARFPRVPSVYFLREGNEYAEPPRPGSLIKIGFAVCVAVRLRELQVGNPRKLFIVATLPGPEALERELHRRFVFCRLGSGEWFRPHPQLLALIEEAKRSTP